MKTVLAEQPAPVEFGLTDKLERFLLSRPETPILDVDLDVIEAKYLELRYISPLHPFITR